MRIGARAWLMCSAMAWQARERRSLYQPTQRRGVRATRRLGAAVRLRHQQRAPDAALRDRRALRSGRTKRRHRQELQENARIFAASSSGIDMGQEAIFLCVPLPLLQMMHILGRDERDEASRQHRPSVLAAMTQPAISIRWALRHRAPPRTGGIAPWLFDTRQNTLMMPVRALSAL